MTKSTLWVVLKFHRKTQFGFIHAYVLSTAQRSAHELPMVERQDVDSCLVYGGQQMILTGQNFTAESKVVFTEKTPGKPYFVLFP